MFTLRNNFLMAARRPTLLNQATLRVFSATHVEPSLSDIADVLKVNYTEEFN